MIHNDATNMPKHEIIVGDNRTSMAALPEQHFHACVTSPPYFGLRDYGGDEREIGKEASPEEFVAAMRAVFGGKDNPVGVWRVLRDDGVCWLNLGDSYNSAASGQNGLNGTLGGGRPCGGNGTTAGRQRLHKGLKHKDLIGIPWRVALALQADGWYLRDAVIWHKPAPMPGSQRDRCTASYEFIFQLTKRERYFFDLDAVKEPCDTGAWDAMPPIGSIKAPGNNGNATYSGNTPSSSGYRTPRNVWKMAHEGFNEAHFATFPVELPTRCIKASTSERGCCGACGKPIDRVIERNRRPTRPGKDNTTDATGLANRDELRHVTATSTVGWSACGCGKPLVPCRVLDPFNGAGTTGVAAVRLGCDYTGCELNPEYAAMSERRIGREKSPATFRDDRDLVGDGLFAGVDNA